MLVSVGLRAVVGMIPLFSGNMLRFALWPESERSGGFKRRTSSRSSCRIRDPRDPIQPVGDADDFCVDIATPLEDRPYSSIDVTPTIVIHSRSLSSRPSSEAREYIIDDIGSEYDDPRP
jgi:hypothetical protein